MQVDQFINYRLQTVELLIKTIYRRTKTENYHQTYLTIYRFH